MSSATAANATTLPPPPRGVRRRPGWRLAAMRAGWLLFQLVGLAGLVAAVVPLDVGRHGRPVTATVAEVVAGDDADDGGRRRAAHWHDDLAGRRHADGGRLGGPLNCRVQAGDLLPARAAVLPGGWAYSRRTTTAPGRPGCSSPP